MYLKISNRGEMDPQALTLLGASSKRGDNAKIGMFGSGNKYAIAYLLRNKIGLDIYSGEKQIVVHTEKEYFRENSFEVIYIDNQKTSITTDSGPQWVLWKAIREIYSNAIDEGLVSMGIVSSIQPISGETHFYVELTDEVRHLHDNFSRYFAIDKQTLFSLGGNKIYKKEHQEGIVFRKGIRCVEGLDQMLFEYDVEGIDLTEDRVVRNRSTLNNLILTLLFECVNKKVVSSILDSRQNGSWELGLFSKVYSWSLPDAGRMTETWKECLYGKKICLPQATMIMTPGEILQCAVLPNELFDIMNQRFGNDIVHPSLLDGGKVSAKYKRVNLDPLQAQMLKEVLEFFKECQYEIEYPIDAVKFASAKTHGMAKEGTILLSIDAFSRGKDWVANVIIEEQIHLKYEAKDESRDFQDSSICELITYMKKANAYTL